MSEGAILTGRLEGIRVGAWCAVIALGLMSAWLGAVGLGALSAAGDLSDALATARAHWAGPVLFVIVAVVLLADQLSHHAVLPIRGARPSRTGIEGRPVPPEQSAPASGVPRIDVAQLAQPFRLRSATDGAS
jgi:hypothetical protein